MPGEIANEFRKEQLSPRCNSEVAFPPKFNFKTVS